MHSPTLQFWYHMKFWGCVRLNFKNCVLILNLQCFCLLAVHKVPSSWEQERWFFFRISTHKDPRQPSCTGTTHDSSPSLWHLCRYPAKSSFALAKNSALSSLRQQVGFQLDYILIHVAAFLPSSNNHMYRKW